MSVKKVRAWVFIAAVALIASVAAQETYHQRTASAGDRRASGAMERFRSSLSNSKQSEVQSSNRILLSFSSLVPANKIIGDMVKLGIEIEELQVCAGENCYSFPIDRQNPLRAEPAAREAAIQSIGRNEAALNRQIASETLESTRHWLLESLRFTKDYQSRIAESKELLISGASCFATDTQIEALIAAMPSIVRAVEYPGTLRMMSIPVDVFRGPHE